MSTETSAQSAVVGGEGQVGGKSSTASKSSRVVFDSQMLVQGEGTTIDTTRFERADFIMPGNYRLDLLVNGQWRATEDIELRDSKEPQGGQFCYDHSLLVRIGIDLKKLDSVPGTRSSSELIQAGLVCVSLDQYIPGVTVKIDLAEQKIDLSVPQYFLQQAVSKTYVDPANWNRGVSAGLLNYNTNLFSSQNNGHSVTNGYAGLNMGVNVGAIRLRHNGTVTWSPETGGRYQRGYLYGQTDLPNWSSQLLVGESATSADLFDSVSFRGVQLSSDDRMLPDTQRYYAPVVRGTANSNAKVAIYQRGYLVYETTVAPGPFEIADLQLASFGGDLQVTVTEANGQSSTFTVPFATTVQLLRPGSTRYNLTAGQVADPGLRGGTQYVAQGTVQHGIDNRFTGYAGTAFTGSYMSALMGAAVNTSIGGFAVDVTQAKTDVPRAGNLQGASLRLSYSKNLPDSGTNFSLLAYRYSTSGFLGLHDAIALQDVVEQGAKVDSFARVRDRLDVNISQRVGLTAGNLYLTGSSLNYWNKKRKALNFALGYSNQWRGNSYSIAVQRMQGSSGYSRNGGGENNTVVSFNLSIPLGRETRGAPVVSTFVSHDQRSGSQVTSGVSGTMDERGNASYAVSVSHDSQQRETTNNASLNYRLPRVSLGSSLSQGHGYRQGSVSASGGMILHSDGLTFAQTLGETTALVHAPNAQGAEVGYTGASVDKRGYAVVPSLTPYQLNTVDIDPKGIADDVELQVSSRNVAPVAGAVVKLSYPTRKARSFLIDSKRPDGELLPFAATAIDVESGQEVGAVGQGSRLVLRSEKDRGSIRVEWGSEPGQQCLIDYVLPARDGASGKGYDVFDLPCRALPAAGPARQAGQS